MLTFAPDSRQTFQRPLAYTGVRELREEEIHLVSGGDANSDALACALAALAALEAPSIGMIGVALGLCGVASQSAPVSVNCAPDNACVDASVDGSDGNGSAGSCADGCSAGDSASTD
ncbi:hypothetical protein [Variovorax sp. PBL-H6]|uniref:hypothetical protein n=1 Tax=Variovorax sp. PBL-H6 TaxID=434009 RepID=UPI0013A57DCA|nr:hypothetical protein [Variovorax sp. PBL-H6]